MIVQSYNCKQILFGLVHAGKMAEVALLNEGGDGSFKVRFGSDTAGIH